MEPCPLINTASSNSRRNGERGCHFPGPPALRPGNNAPIHSVNGVRELGPSLGLLLFPAGRGARGLAVAAKWRVGTGVPRGGSPPCIFG